MLHTSRFMGRAKGDVEEVHRIGLAFTQQQLAGWGVRYHELYMGKPRYDVLVDDRSIFYKPDVKEIAAQLNSMRAPHEPDKPPISRIVFCRVTAFERRREEIERSLGNLLPQPLHQILVKLQIVPGESIEAMISLAFTT